jgi:hypothetical protein
MNPMSEKNVIATAPLAALKRRFLKRPTSSIGARVRRSQATKATRSTADTTKPTRLRVASQPWFGASMIV